VDGLFNHAVNKFRERLKCHCSGHCLFHLIWRTLECHRPKTFADGGHWHAVGDGMAADEFNRKYHPFPALFNLISKSPKLDRVRAFRSCRPHLVSLAALRSHLTDKISRAQACDTDWDVLRMYDEWFREPLDDLRRNVGQISSSSACDSLDALESLIGVIEILTPDSKVATFFARFPRPP